MLLGLIALVAVIHQPAAAHGYIVRAIPEDRTTLQYSPARLQYWFSEGLEPEFSTVTLRDQTGAVIAEGGVDPENTSLLQLQVPGTLPDGAYVVDLRPAFASDGHVVAETRVFFVGEEVGGVAGSQSGYEVIPLEVLWRTLLLASNLLLFGTAVLYRHVLLPAWGNPQHAAGWLPPRVMHRLNRIFGAALAVAFAGNIIAILQQSMAFFNTSIDQVVAQGLWQVVRIGSRFGDVWTARMLLLALAGVLFGLSVRWREERPATVRSFWSVNVWVGALLVGAFSIASHAAGSLIMPWVAVFVDWAHMLSVGMWAGGLVALALVLPAALRPYSGEARRQALLSVLRRFSWLVAYALAVVVTTGIYSALNWLYQPSDLVQTGWGMSLLVKLALVASVLVLGLMHYLSANSERFQVWSARLERAVNLLLTLRLEALLVLLVLVSVAYLSASAVPEPVSLTESVAAPRADQVVDDLTVHVTISPGGPGVNTYDVVLEPDIATEVRMQVIDPAQDWRGDWQEVPPAGPGLYVTAGDEIDQEGRWVTLLDITTPEGSIQRAAFAWDVSQESAVPVALEPGLLNWLALAGVVAALSWAAYPMLYRFYQWLDWRPASVAAGAGAILASILLIVMAVVLVRQSEADYLATLNPPPQMVNPVLPDAGSLALGRELYTQHCIDWQSHSGDFRALVERLPRTRDEALFLATQEGWRSLPSCSGDLSDEQRWHIVNFFRTLG